MSILWTSYSIWCWKLQRKYSGWFQVVKYEFSKPNQRIREWNQWEIILRLGFKVEIIPARALRALSVPVLPRLQGRGGGGVLSPTADVGPWFARLSLKAAFLCSRYITKIFQASKFCATFLCQPQSHLTPFPTFQSLTLISSFHAQSDRDSRAGGTKRKRSFFLISSKCSFRPLFHFQIMPSWAELCFSGFLLSNSPLKMEFWHLTSFWCCLRSFALLKGSSFLYPSRSPWNPLLSGKGWTMVISLFGGSSGKVWFWCSSSWKRKINKTWNSSGAQLSHKEGLHRPTICWLELNLVVSKEDF